MLAAPAGAHHFDDSAERVSLSPYHRAPRGARGASGGGALHPSHASNLLAGMVAGPPPSEAWVKPSSRATVARAMANNLPSSPADADGRGGSDILAGDLYMRMVDELVARWADPARAGAGGGDDDVYFFQHSSPRAPGDAPRGHGALGGAGGLGAACQAAAAEAGAQRGKERPEQQQQPRRAAPGQKAGMAAAAELQRQRDLEMDRLDSALARHQGQPDAEPQASPQQQQQRGARSAAVDIPDARPGKQAGGGAAAREAPLYTAAGSAPASPFGSIPQASKECTPVTAEKWLTLCAFCVGRSCRRASSLGVLSQGFRLGVTNVLGDARCAAMCPVQGERCVLQHLLAAD